MEKILAIVRREYLQRVRTRAFLISTIAAPALLLVFALLPAFLATHGSVTRHITVLDQSGDPGLYPAIQARLQGSKSGTQVTMDEVAVAPGQDLDEVRKTYRSRLDKASNSAIVVLGPDIFNGGEAEYDSNNVSDPSIEEIGRDLSTAVVDRRLAKAGLDSGKIDQYTMPVEMKKIRLSAEGATEDSGQSLAVAWIMVLGIYMAVLIYGIMTMRSVIEEKQSRIVEVVVSSVEPFQMMMGKLLGVGAVALTQVAIWAASAAIVTTGTAAAFTGGVHLPHVPASLYLYFVTFFILGYFLFATLYAMVGAMVSSEDEGQQMQAPITMFIVVAMLSATMIMRDPNGPASVAASFFPFFSPMLMMLRVAISSPPLWQPLLAIVVMLLTIVAAVWVAGRVYRICILMYGKRPSLAELGRWIRYS
ncbi:MAG TPA: ABC transporter permease [Blastocatellia bacterium]